MQMVGILHLTLCCNGKNQTENSREVRVKIYFCIDDMFDALFLVNGLHQFYAVMHFAVFMQ